jgi:small subunit ribosomal protein S16
MLMIRLSRVGKKKQPEYRLIVSEKQKDPWGDFLEQVGFFNPRSNPPIVNFKTERIQYWLSKGAQVSNTVKNLLIAQNVISGKKIKPRGMKAKKEEVKEETKTASEVSTPTETPPSAPVVEEQPSSTEEVKL